MRQGLSKCPAGTVSVGSLCFHLRRMQRSLSPGSEVRRAAEAGAILDENPGVGSQGASAIPCHPPKVVASQVGHRRHGHLVTHGGRGLLSPWVQKHHGMKVNMEALTG